METSKSELADDALREKQWIAGRFDEKIDLINMLK